MTLMLCHAICSSYTYLSIKDISVTVTHLLIFISNNSFPNFQISSWMHTHLLTPQRRLLFEKLTVPQLVKKFPTFYGTQRFITTFTLACHLSQLDSVHAPTSYLLKIHSWMYTWPVKYLITGSFSVNLHSLCVTLNKT